MTAILPHSLEAEEALLGSLFVDPNLYQLLPILPEDFYALRNQMVFRAFQRIVQRGEAADFLTVRQELENRAELDQIGGAAYLTRLTVDFPSSLNAESYLAILKEKRTRREQIKLASRMASDALDADKDLASERPGYIVDLAAAASVSHGARPIKQVISELYDEIDERSKNPQDVWGVNTGYAKLNYITGGWQPGELTIVCGDSGVGKTMFMLSAAQKAAIYAPGAYYCMEMRDRALARRMISQVSSVPVRAMKTGHIQEDQWSSLVQSLEVVGNLRLFLSDSVQWDTTALRADLARLKAQSDIRWAVVDYLWLLKDAGGKDEIERSNIISRNLKMIARELEIALVVIHSIVKTTDEDAPVSNNNARGSKQIIFDADNVAFFIKFNPKLYPAYKAGSNAANMRVWVYTKLREGDVPENAMVVVKHPDCPAYEECIPGGY